MARRYRRTRRNYQGMFPFVPLIEMDDWADEGACTPAGAGAAWDAARHFDPRRVTAAKAVCAGCPVVTECFDFALRSNMREGVWGGQDMSRSDERRRGEAA